MRIEDLLEQFGAYGLEKQEALSEFLGEHNWWLDLPAGTVDFGQGRIYQIQLVGSESKTQQSWLWAWANTASKIPQRLLHSANQIREFGVREQVQQLVEAELALETIDSHVLGLVAVGIAGADAYYLGHHDGGAVLFLISGSGLQRLQQQSVLRMTTVFTTFISQWEIQNHQRAFVAYATAKGCRTTVTDSGVECVNTVGEKIRGDFDERGLLVRLSSTAGPHHAPS